MICPHCREKQQEEEGVATACAIKLLCNEHLLERYNTLKNNNHNLIGKEILNGIIAELNSRNITPH